MTSKNTGQALMSDGVAQLLVDRLRLASSRVAPAGIITRWQNFGDALEGQPAQDVALAGLRAKYGGTQVYRWAQRPQREKYMLLPNHRQQFVADDAHFKRLDEALKGDPAFVARREKRRVLQLNPLEHAAIQEAFPDLVIEAVRPMRPASCCDGSPFERALAQQADGVPVRIHVTDTDDRPVKDAAVFLSPDGSRAYAGRSDDSGMAEFQVMKSHDSFTLVVKAQGDFWPLRLQGVKRKDPTVVTLRRLPDVPFWGWQLIQPPGTRSGQGVRVAVIDSGVEHPSIRVSGGTTFLPGQPYQRDGFGHGTHCAGIIAAQGGGLAPAVELYSYRVMDDQGEGGDTDIVGAAIDQAVTDGCHLINLSLTADRYSAGLHNALKAAYDQGVLCVAASGNEYATQKELMFPARHPETASVGALGQWGTYEPDSLSGDALSGQGRAADWFVANFSCRGQLLKFIAPGVAIVSTVPWGHAVMDGTSMAAAHITGVACLLLEAQPALLQRGAGKQRCEDLLQALATHSMDLGLPRLEQGLGCPVFR